MKSGLHPGSQSALPVYQGLQPVCQSSGMHHCYGGGRLVSIDMPATYERPFSYILKIKLCRNQECYNSLKKYSLPSVVRLYSVVLLSLCSRLVTVDYNLVPRTMKNSIFGLEKNAITRRYPWVSSKILPDYYIRPRFKFQNTKKTLPHILQAQPDKYHALIQTKSRQEISLVPLHLDLRTALTRLDFLKIYGKVESMIAKRQKVAHSYYTWCLALPNTRAELEPNMSWHVFAIEIDGKKSGCLQ
ncbi:hypothetical protein M422DRAFT_42362 [Sphaerobolus stellatus SS14]|nr:hypothetical protein M422DRAFT_42362 [Sphaerobolus stellatus SS14]